MSIAFRIYLASRSPRRQELLNQAGIAFDLLPFNSSPAGQDEVDETPFPNEDPVKYASRLSCAKAMHGIQIVEAGNFKQQPVLAADTTLEFEGKIIGKPVDHADASRILQSLSGQTHRVITAVSLAYQGKIETICSISNVRFCPLSQDEIDQYVASGEPMDKAGAYGIQGRAALFVEHLEGSYSGVMGLPLYETGLLIKRFSEI